MSQSATIGRVTSYAAARIFPRSGSMHTAEEIFLDYVGWCVTSRHVPLRDGVFRERFADVARSVGIPTGGEWADRIYLDVALGRP